MKQLKVKPWGKDQGDFVEINEEDFDPSFHELIEGEKPAKRGKAKADEGDGGDANGADA